MADAICAPNVAETDSLPAGKDRLQLDLDFDGRVLGASPLKSGSSRTGTLTIDAHLQLSELPTETTRKTSPADYVGDYTAGGSILNVGVTAGFAFDKRTESRAHGGLPPAVGR